MTMMEDPGVCPHIVEVKLRGVTGIIVNRLLCRDVNHSRKEDSPSPPEDMKALVVVGPRSGSTTTCCVSALSNPLQRTPLGLKEGIAARVGGKQRFLAFWNSDGDVPSIVFEVDMPPAESKQTSSKLFGLRILLTDGKATIPIAAAELTIRPGMVSEPQSLVVYPVPCRTDSEKDLNLRSKMDVYSVSLFSSRLRVEVSVHEKATSMRDTWGSIAPPFPIQRFVSTLEDAIEVINDDAILFIKETSTIEIDPPSASVSSASGSTSTNVAAAYLNRSRVEEKKDDLESLAASFDKGELSVEVLEDATFKIFNIAANGMQTDTSGARHMENNKTLTNLNGSPGGIQSSNSARALAASPLSRPPIPPRYRKLRSLLQRPPPPPPRLSQSKLSPPPPPPSTPPPKKKRSSWSARRRGVVSSSKDSSRKNVPEKTTTYDAESHQRQETTIPKTPTNISSKSPSSFSVKFLPTPTTTSTTSVMGEALVVDNKDKTEEIESEVSFGSRASRSSSGVLSFKPQLISHLHKQHETSASSKSPNNPCVGQQHSSSLFKNYKIGSMGSSNSKPKADDAKSEVTASAPDAVAATLQRLATANANSKHHVSTTNLDKSVLMMVEKELNKATVTLDETVSMAEQEPIQVENQSVEPGRAKVAEQGSEIPRIHHDVRLQHDDVLPRESSSPLWTERWDMSDNSDSATRSDDETFFTSQTLAPLQSQWRSAEKVVSMIPWSKLDCLIDRIPIVNLAVSHCASPTEFDDETLDDGSLFRNTTMDMETMTDGSSLAIQKQLNGHLDDEAFTERQAALLAAVGGCCTHPLQVVDREMSVKYKPKVSEPPKFESPAKYTNDYTSTIDDVSIAAASSSTSGHPNNEIKSKPSTLARSSSHGSDSLTAMSTNDQDCRRPLVKKDQVDLVIPKREPGDELPQDYSPRDRLSHQRTEAKPGCPPASEDLRPSASIILSADDSPVAVTDFSPPKVTKSQVTITDFFRRDKIDDESLIDEPSQPEIYVVDDGEDVSLGDLTMTTHEVLVEMARLKHEFPSHHSNFNNKGSRTSSLLLSMFTCGTASDTWCGSTRSSSPECSSVNCSSVHGSTKKQASSSSRVTARSPPATPTHVHQIQNQKHHNDYTYDDRSYESLRRAYANDASFIDPERRAAAEAAWIKRIES